LTIAFEGVIVFAPGPEYPEFNPDILHVGSQVNAFLTLLPLRLLINLLIPYSFLKLSSSNGSLFTTALSS
jgi:hypothetical protein